MLVASSPVFYIKCVRATLAFCKMNAIRLFNVCYVVVFFFSFVLIFSSNFAFCCHFFGGSFFFNLPQNDNFLFISSLSSFAREFLSLFFVSHSLVGHVSLCVDVPHVLTTALNNHWSTRLQENK